MTFISYSINMIKIFREIGKKIRTERNKQELSQEKLAEMVGMDARSIVAIETGDRNPTVKTLYKVCRALKIPSASILPF